MQNYKIVAYLLVGWFWLGNIKILLIIKASLATADLVGCFCLGNIKILLIIKASLTTAEVSAVGCG